MLSHEAHENVGRTQLRVSRYLLAERCFETIDIFEQQSSVEGAWSYSLPDESEHITIPQTNPFQPVQEPRWQKSSDGAYRAKFTTPMYDYLLETNIPSPLMQFSDKPFPKDSQLYPTRQAVSRYLEEYAAEVRHFIKFQTQVIDVQLQTVDGIDSWIVRSKDLTTEQASSAQYDAVLVCIGHYTVPYAPDVPGIQDWDARYPGSISHSKLYRSPDRFTGRKIVIVGNSASGMDIAKQISTVAQHPVIISGRSESFLAVPGGKLGDTSLRSMPPIVEFIDPSSSNRAIRFANGLVEEDVDHIVFCTGYLYSFPFLDSLRPQLITDGFRVHHLYQHMFYMDHPSLVFLALPMRVLPFPLSEAQASVVAPVWSRRLSLPSREEMLSWEQKTVEENGDGKKFHTLNFPKEFDYHNLLCDWALQAGLEIGKRAYKWTKKEYWLRERFAAIREAFTKKGNARHQVQTLEQLGFDFEAWRNGQAVQSLL